MHWNSPLPLLWLMFHRIRNAASNVSWLAYVPSCERIADRTCLDSSTIVAACRSRSAHSAANALASSIEDPVNRQHATRNYIIIEDQYFLLVTPRWDALLAQLPIIKA
jgi:DNA-binding GntR family transcriptional regulator